MKLLRWDWPRQRACGSRSRRARRRERGAVRVAQPRDPDGRRPGPGGREPPPAVRRARHRSGAGDDGLPGARDARDRGAADRVVTPGTDYEQCDGLWTDEPGQGLMLVTADCLPIALARADGDRLVVLHAGWRGLLAGIAEAGGGARRRRDRRRDRPGDRRVLLRGRRGGGGALRRAVRRRRGAGRAPRPRSQRRRALDAAGVARVDRVGGCTACDPETFFSHRRDRGAPAGRGSSAARPERIRENVARIRDEVGPG